MSRNSISMSIQYRHNAGSGFTFGYDMEEIDKTFDDLRKLVKKWPESIPTDEIEKLLEVSKPRELCEECGDDVAIHNGQCQECYDAMHGNDVETSGG